MVWIADSGSSKTEWRLIDEEATIVSSVNTQGLNPYFVSQQKIKQVISQYIKPIADKIDRVYFYGAGCGDQRKANEVRKTIEHTLNTSMCKVAGDMLGTARSLLKNESGIACILGTGANSCVYNGQIITKNAPSLGYMLSDWGSGSVMGKDLLKLILQEKLPSHMIVDFFDTFKMTRTEILDRLYNKPMPNRFLASFAPFILSYAEEPPCHKLIIDNFKEFFQYYVLCYRDNGEQPVVHLSGSVAYYFRKYLNEVANQLDIKIGSIVQCPMDGLVQYHGVNISII